MPKLSQSRHPEFNEHERKWEYSWDHYTGLYATEDKIGDYLNQKKQRESNKAYECRKEDSDPVLLFPTAVDSLNGILFGSDHKTIREWGGLGDPEEADSDAHTLLHNADGNGMNWNPLFKQVGIKLTVLHKVWGLVEGVERDGEGNVTKEPHIKVINPQSVVDWYPTDGTPTQVLVKETRDNRSGLRDGQSDKEKDVYTLYELDGWTRIEVDDEGNETEVDSGEYSFYATNDRNRKVLPIFPCELPMPRHIGHLLALKQNHIFNKKSSRDWGVQTMSFALLRIVGNEKQYEAVAQQLNQGANAIQQEPDVSGEHGYMSPDSSYLGEAGNILEQDKKNFYDSAFKQYGDAAKQVTATEIKLESRSGIEAFLNLLVTSLDEFENGCLWRLEQVYYPEQPSQWGEAVVERSREFQPEDINKKLEQLSGAVLNADRAKAVSTKRKVEMLNPDWTEEEVEDEVQRINQENGAIEVPPNMEGA